jgi:16S rRNA (adenine(1408)-N(1))-methyltransferase
MAIDVGTGDGAYVLRAARAEPRRLHVGIDTSADGLRDASRRAGRKPQRGGAPNAMFVRAAADALPEELGGLASTVTVLLPWGSLLEGVARPDPAILGGLRALLAPGGRLLVVLGYDARSDALPGLAPLSRESLEADVLPRYREAGFDAGASPMTIAELRALGTTWASRLAFGKERPFWRIEARVR